MHDHDVFSLTLFHSLLPPPAHHHHKPPPHQRGNSIQHTPQFCSIHFAQLIILLHNFTRYEWLANLQTTMIPFFNHHPPNIMLGITPHTVQEAEFLIVIKGDI
jgi:hypothetical protein